MKIIQMQNIWSQLLMWSSFWFVAKYICGLHDTVKASEIFIISIFKQIWLTEIILNSFAELLNFFYQKFHDALLGGSSVSIAEAPTDHRLLLLIGYEKVRRLDSL
jgi:hypothetical protein